MHRFKPNFNNFSHEPRILKTIQTVQTWQGSHLQSLEEKFRIFAFYLRKVILF